MDDVHFDAIFLIKMLSRVLSAVDRTMLAACATEIDLHVGEPASDEAFDMEVNEFVHTLQESEYLAVGFKEVYDRPVKSRQWLVLVISPGIVCAAAVEDIPASVACLISRYAFLESERIDSDNKRTLGSDIKISVIVYQASLHPFSLLVLFSLPRPLRQMEVDKPLTHTPQIWISVASA